MLGQRTIVGAGAVVTKSFPEGYCVIGGNPARKIKDLEKEKFIPTKSEYEFYGYVPKKEFKKFAQRYLKNNKYYKRDYDEIRGGNLMKRIASLHIMHINALP